MQVFTTVDQLQQYISKRRKKGSIAFVPTLGALHQGHLKLMQHAQQVSNTVVASIFVNPTQFNDPKDLEKYPRPLGNDIHLLSINHIEALFLPTVEEVYPAGLSTELAVDMQVLTNVLEGPARPGHFEGVVTVVKRLLDIVQPDYLIMGQKDYQQQMIVAYMINQLRLPIKLITHPIERDHDGLALSSRNVRIDPDLRPLANTIYLALQHAKIQMHHKPPAQIIEECTSILADKGFRLEYFAIIDGETLHPVDSWSTHSSMVACVAAWLGDVRLIDNMILRHKV